MTRANFVRACRIVGIGALAEAAGVLLLHTGVGATVDTVSATIVQISLALAAAYLTYVGTLRFEFTRRYIDTRARAASALVATATRAHTADANALIAVGDWNAASLDMTDLLPSNAQETWKAHVASLAATYMAFLRVPQKERSGAKIAPKVAEKYEAVKNAALTARDWLLKQPVP